MEKVDTAKPSSRTAMKLMLYSCAQHQTGYHGELHERYLSYTGHDSALCGFAAGTSGSSSGMGQSRKQFLASGQHAFICYDIGGFSYGAASARRQGCWDRCWWTGSSQLQVHLPSAPGKRPDMTKDECNRAPCPGPRSTLCKRGEEDDVQ